MVTKVVPGDNTRIITIRAAEINSINSGAPMVAMGLAGERVATTSFSRWASSRISRLISNRDRANIKCRCQDKLKRALATKRWTRQTSQRSASLQAEPTRKWFIRPKSQNKTNWIIAVGTIRQLIWGKTRHQRSRRARSNSIQSSRNRSRCPCDPSSRTLSR